MPEHRDVLILSKRMAGGVRMAAELIRPRGFRTVLVSERPDDRNRDACDAHVVVDWERHDIEEAARRLEEAGVAPVGAVNMVEPLISWQLRLAERYRLGGAPPGKELLLSKLGVRRALADLGLSRLPFAGGPAEDIDPAGIDFFPVITKPSRDSGASRLVHRADGPRQLADALDRMRKELGDGAEVVIERRIDGLEFSIDGPVERDRLHPLLVVEKPGHDDVRHHDSGVLLSPPEELARSAADDLLRQVDGLCRSVGLDGTWLHVEGRQTSAGAEIIELNPRPGGGMHPAAVRRASGVDPIEWLVLGALPGGVAPAPPPGDRSGGDEILGLLPFEPRETGRVVDATTRDELLAMPAVADAYVWEGFEAASLDQENIFAEVLLSAGSRQEIEEAARKVGSAFGFRMEPLSATGEKEQG